MTMRGSAGGAAAAGGIDFQARVAAWVAVQILGEQDAAPPWMLPADTTLEWLRCETEEPVDDLLVATSGDGFAFIQVKHAVDLSTSPDSELASVLDQFVRQFLSSRTTRPGSKTWQRPLEAMRDRLVLVVGPSAPSTVRLRLPSVLQKIRELVPSQALDDVAKNDDERHALSVLTEHIRRSWHSTLSAAPTEDDIRQILSLAYVQVLAIEGGSDEQSAKNLFRSVVLTDPAQADAAWACLISFCIGLAQKRSGADRIGLQGEMLRFGIGLQITRSYRKDVKRLQEYSSRITSFLRDLAYIRVSEKQIKIVRQSTQQLMHAAEDGSLLVVGDPGSGKSGALHDLVEALSGQSDTLLLAVDRLLAENAGGLRQDLNLEHDLITVIKNWPGKEPAFLVIDALDAARAEPAAQTLRDLIKEVVQQSGRWRVVASVRKFDLRYSPELRELFKGDPPSEFNDPEFSGIRHLNVPKLDQDELSQIEPQSPDLYSLVVNAQSELRDLVSVPFNLRLIADLLGDGMDPAHLSPVRTQLQLLDRYWQHRVLRNDGYRDAREDILRRACGGMVEQRRLRVDRTAVVIPDSSPRLKDLLSNHVLAEWQPYPAAAPDSYVLTFSHHVLLDYSVERLLLRGDPAQMVTRFANSPELVLVVRPSLELYFENTWTLDQGHERFWDVVFRFLSESQIPEVGKLVGPSVAAKVANQLLDFEPLFELLESPQESRRKVADAALRHVIGALLAIPVDGRPIVGPGAGPWCELAERVSRSLASSIASLGGLLFRLCQSPDVFTPEQKYNAGIASRRLLKLAWQRTPRDSRLVILGLECVCRTFESDVAASALLIRQALDAQHIADFGFEELFWLAKEAERLIPLDADLLEDIYRATFAHREKSREPTAMVDSRILGLISHRSQDYNMALHELARLFPTFLSQRPIHAVRALVSVMESFVAQKHEREKVVEGDFDFKGRRAWLRSDLSSIWDSREGRGHEDALTMLDLLEKHLQALARNEAGLDEMRLIIGVLVDENRLACLWRRLLRLGARWPETIGMELLPLASAKPVLTFLDTSYQAGEYLKVVFPKLGAADRGVIERTILSISSSTTDEEHEGHIRDQLLCCLPFSDLTTKEARGIVQALQGTGSVPTNIPPFTFGEARRHALGEDGILKASGVPLEKEPNRRIRSLTKSAEEFVDTFRNQKPSRDGIAAIAPVLKDLSIALATAEADDIDSKLCEFAWDHLAEACGKVVEDDCFSCQDDVGTLVYTTLIAASLHPEPTHRPEDDKQFDESPSWGRPAPRIEAAIGLMMLAHVPDCITGKLLERIEALSLDAIPAVRLQIAANLNLLFRSSPDFMWKILKRVCQQESSWGVLRFVVHGPLERVAGEHAEQITTLIREILNRAQGVTEARAVREACISLLVRLYIWMNVDTCRDTILSIAMDPMHHPDEANQVVGVIRAPLRHGRLGSASVEEDAVRARTWDLVSRVVSSAGENLNNLQAAYANVSFDNWPDEDKEIFKSLMRVIDHVGSEIYFASGAYQRKNAADEDEALTSPERERFYREASSILDDLTDIGLASLAHHLLQTLESFIPFDPPGVFLRIGRVVRAGQKGGYQYESLAADLLVKLVERYLAEYRPVFREDEACRRTLLEVLDIFVQAGWPSARRLTYNLEEIFR